MICCPANLTLTPDVWDFVTLTVAGFPLTALLLKMKWWIIHWEGMIKNIATYYLEYVSAFGLPYGQLKSNFLAVALKYNLQSFEESNKTTIHTTIVNKVINSHDVKFKIPVEGIIKTNSNLNSEIFIEIMATIGLECKEYESSYKLIDTALLQKRNMIAHGERLEALDLDETRYYEIHDKILGLIQLFLNAVFRCIY